MSSEEPIVNAEETVEVAAVVEVSEPEVVATAEVKVETPKVEPVAENKPVVEKKQPVEVSDFNSLIQGVKDNGTTKQKILISAIEKYMVDMQPGKPVGGDAGARFQYMFWKTLSEVIEQSNQEEFKKSWNIILAYFNQFKTGVFHDKYVFRFAEFWAWNEGELNAFQRILNLIKLTCNPAERQVGLKQVSLERSLAEGFSDDGRQRILTFYQA